MLPAGRYTAVPSSAELNPFLVEKGFYGIGWQSALRKPISDLCLIDKQLLVFSFDRMIVAKLIDCLGIACLTGIHHHNAIEWPGLCAESFQSNAYAHGNPPDFKYYYVGFVLSARPFPCEARMREHARMIYIPLRGT